MRKVFGVACLLVIGCGGSKNQSHGGSDGGGDAASAIDAATADADPPEGTPHGPPDGPPDAPPDAPNDASVGHGCDVPTSYATINAAIADVTCDTIWVHPGTYTENVVVGRALAIRGTDPAHPAIVDGASAGSVIAATAALGLSDLVLRNGKAARGGGIHATAALVIERARVETSIAEGPLAAFGGGIDAEDALTLIDVVVTGNIARITDTESAGPRTLAGGGIYHHGVDAKLLRVTVDHNTVTGTGASVTASGGGIAFDGPYAADLASTLTLSHVTVATNAIDLDVDGTARGGGLYFLGVDAWWGPQSVLNAYAATVTGNTLQADVASGGGIAVVAAANFMYPDTRLALTGSTVSGNTVSARAGEGGGISLVPSVGPPMEQWSATLALTTSTVATNLVSAVDGSGGGIAANIGRYDIDQNVTTNVTIDHGTVAGNQIMATHAATGGGIAAWCHLCGSTVQVTRGTVSGNIATGATAAIGGGIAVADSVRPTITSGTLVNNTASSSGGPARGGGLGLSIEAVGGFTLQNATIAGNAASGTDAAGGGIYLTGLGTGTSLMYGAFVTLADSIVAANTAPTSPDCLAKPDDPTYFTYDAKSLGSTLTTSTLADCAIVAGPGDLVVGDAKLGPLAANGGPTQTMALRAGSPAIDKGNPTACSGGTTDQRDFYRNGRCDIGAFERQ